MSARTQKSLNARVSVRHTHATPASLGRSGADAPLRGFLSKFSHQIFLAERNEFGARPQDPSHKRIPGEAVWIPGVAPGRARTGGTSRMALFAADPLLCKQQKNQAFPANPVARKCRRGLKSRWTREFLSDTPMQRRRRWKDLVQTRRSVEPFRSSSHRHFYLSGPSSGPIRKSQPTSGFLATLCGSPGSRQAAPERAELHEWHFSRPIPFYVNNKKSAISGKPCRQKMSARAQKSLNARVSFGHPHATPASLERSGADAPLRGTFSKFFS